MIPFIGNICVVNDIGINLIAKFSYDGTASNQIFRE
jgi:hypothetical protein